MNNRMLYLASPYSKFPSGLEAAFTEVCRAAGLLVEHKIPVFSPIAHTHPIAMASGLDPLDHTIWLPADEPMMHACTGLIMLKMVSWEVSYGMAVEMKTFQAAGKPVFWMEPGIVPAALLRGEG